MGRFGEIEFHIDLDYIANVIIEAFNFVHKTSTIRATEIHSTPFQAFKSPYRGGYDVHHTICAVNRRIGEAGRCSIGIEWNSFQRLGIGGSAHHSGR
jgi:hypothetical protein